MASPSPLAAVSPTGQLGPSEWELWYLPQSLSQLELGVLLELEAVGRAQVQLEVGHSPFASVWFRVWLLASERALELHDHRSNPP